MSDIQPANETAALAHLPTLPKSNLQSAFVFQPTSFREAVELCNFLGGADIVPKDFRGKPANIFIVLQMGARLGVDPGFMLQNTYVVNGRPSMFGDLPLSIVRQSGQLAHFDEGYEGTEPPKAAAKGATRDFPDDYAAWCEVRRAGEGRVVRVTFSVADAKEAGLWNKEGPWRQYPKRMLKFRARSFALRDKFGDVLQGLAIGEEQMESTVRNVTPQQEQAAVGGRSAAVLGQLKNATPALTPEAAAAESGLFAGDQERPETSQAPKAADVWTPPAAAEQTAPPPAQAEAPAAADLAMIDTIRAVAARKGILGSDGLALFLQTRLGSPKITKSNIQQVLDLLNDLPIPPISEDEINRFRGMVALPDARLLASTAERIGMTGDDLHAFVRERTEGAALTREAFGPILAELEQREAAGKAAQ